MTLARRHKHLLSLTLFSVLLSAPAVARAQNVEDAGLWYALFAQGKVDYSGCGCSKWKWWFDGHGRFLDDTDGFHQSILRPGIGYSLTDSFSVWAGYGWIHTVPVRGQHVDEHRVWQQLIWSEELWATKFMARSRLEQRFLSSGAETGWRFRQLVKARRPLRNHPRLSVSVWDELFIHMNDTDFGARAGFNQNRLFAGIGWDGNPRDRWRAEIGYLYQEINVPGFGNNVSNHILSLNLFRKP